MVKKIILILFVSFTAFQISAQKLSTKNIVLVTIDGFRWQEVFNGADSSLMNQQINFVDPTGIKNHFWDDDTIKRRKILLPFIWGVIGTRGQIYGNRKYNNDVNVSNGYWFSYPGYNELLSGHPDDKRINSNQKILNPNSTVLDFFNDQRGYRDRIAVFASWDCFPYIVNARRNGIFVNAGNVKAFGNKLTDNEKLLDKLMPSIPDPLNDVRLDAFTFYYGLEYMKKTRPRIMYFAFDETDDFAHKGEYGVYLNSAHSIDGFLGELWQYIQSEPFYHQSTTLIITADHGRGQTSDEWKSHGKDVPGSDQDWLAIIGPDTPRVGEEKSSGQIYLNQVAKTMAALLGMDYEDSGTAGKVIESVFKK